LSDDGGFLRIAHRGYARAGRENSLEAFASAIVRGADAIELDVRRRPDGVLVVHHDAATAPDAPTLASALELASTAGIEVNLDMKVAGVVGEIIAAVRAAGLLGRASCTGGDWAMLAEIHRREPGIRAGLTVPRQLAPRGARAVQRLWYGLRLPSLLRAHGAGLISANHQLVTRLIVRRAHGAGAQVWAWTVDDPREIARLARIGVDGIASDDPASHGLR
jgi:glycerophosphoryl diester phosphodiesterase